MHLCTAFEVLKILDPDVNQVLLCFDKNLTFINESEALFSFKLGEENDA
jgi:hypothetical protein